jgi:uncharacterized protein
MLEVFWMERPFRIGKTPYGDGLFATKRIETGTCLGKVAGKVLRFDKTTEEQSNYLMDLGSNKVFYPHQPFRNMNHSCNPNAELAYYGEGMYVEVIRTIRPGQQITIDYGWSHEDAIPCQCGSRRCRGWIVAAEELHLLLQGKAADGREEPRAAS